MKLKIDHKSQTPLHKQAEELIRELISRPEYKDGKFLPKEIDLSEQLKISRNTLRQAINTLVFEGLLVRKKGVGTRVAGKKVFSGASNWLSFSQEMKILGLEIQNFELHITRREASPDVASFFNIKPETKVLCLERLRGKKEYPFVYFVSEFNPKIPVSASENFNRPLYEILEADYGIVVKISKEEISAAAADSFIASKLEIAVGDPILIRKRYVYDVNNVPVEYNIGWYRADSFTYTIECSRDVEM
ncbi:GntR family transcriptional regulator [Dysgonomonas sp. 25]|uniref:GntR family transcriptional regulator n=1 Tax=Dysgonomonas sp. 25 TaxID=2302933 RepID=UPI0013D4298E|nr:GntR family transcriptional regulator [Dysgonomonas sp. 25]NDV70165.1 GntR family transcriptional regulator [Dysgonomonas sp. 25]